MTTQVYAHTDPEQKLIGVILMKPELILSAPIEARWFERNYRVIEAMLSLVGQGINIDIFTVSKEMGGKGLNTLIDYQKNSFANPKNYNLYIDELRSNFEARIVRTSIESALSSIDNGVKPTEVLNSLISASMKSTTPDSKNFNYTVKEAMIDFIDELTEIYDGSDKHIGLMTGLDRIDRILGGIHPSDMVIVGARPGVGKTAFALSILKNLAKSGKRVGFFSTEMAVKQVMGRLTSLESGVHAVKFRTGALVEEDFPRLTLATNNIANYNFRICDKPAITIGELVMQARAWMADGGIDFIAVDYLTRLHPDKSRNNQTLDVGDIVTGLKNLARTLNVPVMVLAQLNRGSENRVDKTPVMSDLRDSGVVEQEADQIMMLYRPDDGEPEIIIEKNRHGAVGSIRCNFNHETMEWADKDD
jgi:replicative DNA helicase